MAGANVSAQQTQLNALIDLRMNNFAQDFTHGSYEGVLRRSKNFMFMTPELAAYFRSRTNTSSLNALNAYTTSAPYWFVNKFENVSGEGVYQTLYEYEALFQAKAWIKQDPYTDLVKYIDTPAFWRGDLYHIQNLTALLESANVPPQTVLWDLDNDSDVDFVDLKLFFPKFSSIYTIFDINSLIKNFGR